MKEQLEITCNTPPAAPPQRYTHRDTHTHCIYIYKFKTKSLFPKTNLPSFYFRIEKASQG